MLTLTITFDEEWDSEKELFIYPTPLVIELEHSLLSVSKWEEKYEKPFLTEAGKSQEELIDYVFMMVLTPGFTMEHMSLLKQEHMDEISTYINSKRSATWFYDDPNSRGSRNIITNELIYYWMDSFQIDWEAQTWHINRLLTLVRIHNEKQGEPKKRSQAEVIAERRMLNARRKKDLGTSG
jgi:hypothetical protein